jgi:capsular exopolysaccharide synthesis family protein
LDRLKLIKPAEAQPPGKVGPFRFGLFVPEIRRSALSEKLQTIHREGSFVSEQFKTLKIKVGDVKVITISSPQTEDGKTLIAANLAASFSKDPGRRVLVADCDLRNPSLHRVLGIRPDPGLLGYLENAHLKPYCYMRRFENLYVMTAGGIAPNPIELLTQGKMKQLIESLKADFDTVIIDSPPFAPISDAQILTGLSDGLVLVVRCGKTSYRNIEKTYASLDRSKLLGVVLNDVKPMMFNTQYDYKYYHYKHRDHYPYKGTKPLPKEKTYLDS